MAASDTAEAMIPVPEAKSSEPLELGFRTSIQAIVQ